MTHLGTSPNAICGGLTTKAETGKNTPRWQMHVVTWKVRSQGTPD